MALLFADSFDHYQTGNLLQKYTAVGTGATIEAGLGTCGSACLQVISDPSRGGVTYGATSSGRHVLAEVRVKTVVGTNPGLFNVSSGATNLFSLTKNADGSLTGKYNPGAAFPPISFVTPGGLVPNTQWTKVGMDLLLGDSGTGGVTIQINGAQVYTATGITTTTAGIVSWSGIAVGLRTTGTLTTLYDDLTIGDGSGSAPWNALLGNTQVQALFADGAGTNTDFSVTGAAANWNVSDNDSPDPTTAYVSSGVVGAIDTYTYSDLPFLSGTVVYGVQVSSLAAEIAGAGSRTLDAAVSRGGSTVAAGQPHGVPTTDYHYLIAMLMTDPLTSAQWLATNVNSSEFGPKVTA